MICGCAVLPISGQPRTCVILEDYDEGAVAEEYSAFAFPTSFLVDHNGMIR